MKRKRSELGDCLELLLDTMCNTFGGIMFIAMALVVISAQIPSVGEVEEKSVTEQEERGEKIEIPADSELDRRIEEEKEKIKDLEQKLSKKSRQWLSNGERKWLEFTENTNKTTQKQKIWMVMKQGKYWILNRRNKPIFDEKNNWNLAPTVKGEFLEGFSTLKVSTKKSAGLNEIELIKEIKLFSSDKFYVEARIYESNENFEQWRQVRNGLAKDFVVNWLPETNLDESLKILVRKVQK